ncbi:MAG: ABC transporter permease, partial [Myxococcales bacterium]|nr:ABC transporter permease [Myxococcales bacterium]
MGQKPMESLSLLIAASIDNGTVLALAALGLLLNERSGIVNLGAEGIMLLAAIAAFATDARTGSDALAFVAGGAAGAAMAFVFGVLVIWLESNQYAAGLALSLFGAGLSSFVGIPFTQERLSERPHFDLPVLARVPFLGNALFRHHPVVYGTMALAGGAFWFFARCRAGLVLRGVGDSPESAHALGFRVRPIRLAAVCAGGTLA